MRAFLWTLAGLTAALVLVDCHHSPHPRAPSAVRAEERHSSPASVVPSPLPSHDVRWLHEYGNFRGVQRPEAWIDLATKPEGLEDGTAQCLVFPEWVVIDPGECGDDGRTRVRRRAPGEEASRACREQSPKDVLIDNDTDWGQGDVVGFAGAFLVLDPDYENGTSGLEFYDPETGRKFIEISYDSDRPVVFKPAGRTGSLKYFAEIDVQSCRLASPGCWQRILRKAGVPASVTVPPPVCPPKSHGGEPGLVWAYVPAHIDDIRHPKVAFDSGQPDCILSP